MALETEQTFISEVKGFLADDEGQCLYEIALQAGKMGPCLEIGSYCGKSTVYLGSACKKNNSILFSIDHHRGSEEQQPGEEYFDPDLYDPQTGEVDTFREFRRTIKRAGIEETVIPIVCRSDLAARGWVAPLSLVFIDGGHAYETVYTDYNAWAGHIIPGGYLLFHDIFSDPTQGGQAPYRVYNLAKACGLFRAHAMVGTLGVLQRVAARYKV
jgi:predicted O-methyltransferase YrrM